jgi:hypothetical protein
MALSNVGCAIARDPETSRPVLVVDWDLEAPGLHRYFWKQVSSAFNGNESAFNQAPGLIDLFIALQECVPPDGPTTAKMDYGAVTSLLDEFPLTKFIIKTDVPGLHLLKAGKFDEAYASKVASYEWSALYDRSPYLLRAFADRLERNPLSLHHNLRRRRSFGIPSG